MYIEIYILIQLCIFRKLHYKKVSKEKKKEKEKKVMKISNNGATRRVPLVEHELLTLPRHTDSPHPFW
jgi:hypothetical protein